MTDRRLDEVEDSMLMALADGELPADEAATLHARIAASPALAERYAVFAETAAALRAAWDQGPVPDEWVRMIREAPMEAGTATDDASVVAFRPRNTARVGMAPVWRMALAACLTLAIGAGGFLAGQRSGTGPGDIAAGPLLAARMLEQTPTGGTAPLPDGSTARALASFDTEMGLCRLLSVETADAASTERAIACRTGDDWRVALAVASVGDAGFVPASDLAVGLVDDFLTEIGAGPALDPEAERAALAD